MRMTPSLLIVGGLIIFASVLFVAVSCPGPPSPTALRDLPAADRPRGGGTDDLRPERLHLLPHPVHPEHRLGPGGRADRPGRATTSTDQPHLLGTERTGPDLSQEGGEHPDDWHLAHFINPRFVAARVDHARLASSWARKRSRR